MYQAEIIISFKERGTFIYKLIHCSIGWLLQVPTNLSVYRPHKELISIEINNDNDLNSHNMTKCRAGFATDSPFLVTLSHVTRFKA